jgi:hypothetical protein
MEQPKFFRWSLKPDGQFTVSSMYQAMVDSNIVPYNRYMWKIKIPLKIKIFLCLLYREEILTEGNLVKRNMHGNVTCCFCNNYETIQHLFFDCNLTKFIWRVIQLTFGLGTPNNIKNVYNA